MHKFANTYWLTSIKFFEMQSHLLLLLNRYFVCLVVITPKYYHVWFPKFMYKACYMLTGSDLEMKKVLHLFSLTLEMISELDVSESSQFISELDVSELTEHVSESSQYVSELDIIKTTH